jgi:hypothetical protein
MVARMCLSVMLYVRCLSYFFFFFVCCPRLGLPSITFPSGSIPSKNLVRNHTCHLPHTCCVCCASHLPLKCLSSIWRRAQVVEISLFNFIQLSVTFCSLDSNIILNILCSTPKLPLDWESKFVGAVIFLLALNEQYWLSRKLLYSQYFWRLFLTNNKFSNYFRFTHA